MSSPTPPGRKDSLNDGNSENHLGESKSLDRDEFVALFSSHSARIYGFIMALVMNHNDTEEVFQNTSVVLWDKFADFTPGTSFFSWASRVAYLEVLGFRKQRRLFILSDEALSALADEVRVRSSHATERRDALSVCLDKLNVQDRQMIEHRYYQQRSPKQIAVGAIDLPRAWPRSRRFVCLHRANDGAGGITMSGSRATFKEVQLIVLTVSAGEATEAEWIRLNELILGDQAAKSYAVQMLEQLANLSWRGLVYGDSSQVHDSVFVANASNEPGIFGQSSTEQADSGRIQDRYPLQHEVGIKSAPSAQRNAQRYRIFSRADAPLRSASFPALRRHKASVAAFVCGALLSALVGYGGLSENTATVSDESQTTRSADPPPALPYRARLVSGTACLWNANSGPSSGIGNVLANGESLQLLEGIAELELNWSRGGNASFRLEGPAAMLLSARGMPSLRFGKLTVDARGYQGEITLETPLGSIVVEESASFGVAAFGSDVELHVFKGQARLETPKLARSHRDQALFIVDAGQAIWLRGAHEGAVEIEQRPAEEGYFVARVSMGSNPLLIPHAYVDAVLQAEPVGYWRFDNDQPELVRNEAANRLHCHIVGSLGTVGNRRNRSVEFGVTAKGGAILCDQVLDDIISDQYTLEAWVKPSHYHVGAMISLIGDASEPDGQPPHGALLELGGTSQTPSGTSQPGRIRYLHRDPNSDNKSGTSCFSERPYRLREWQHVVAVKEGPRMRLYLDGRLASEHENTAALPKNMRLLIGRLFPSQDIRPFIGQVDEVALYDRALGRQEIEHHFSLVRPQSNLGKDI